MWVCGSNSLGVETVCLLVCSRSVLTFAHMILCFLISEQRDSDSVVSQDWISFEFAYIKLKTILISSIPNNCPVWGWNPCLSSPSHQGQVQSCCLSCSRHYFLHPTEFRVVLYILSQCSGIPARCQLLFCKISCGWRCSPDVAVERDVLHFHLLLRHLLSPQKSF